MNQEYLYYACAVAAVILSGLAKGGFAGVGALAMPIMALGVDPVKGAAILLPILILQDAVSVWSFRHSWDRHIAKVMLQGLAIDRKRVVQRKSVSERVDLGGRRNIKKKKRKTG